jgi:hypothetical protein
MKLATSKSHAAVLQSGVAIALESMPLIHVCLIKLGAATAGKLTTPEI